MGYLLWRQLQWKKWVKDTTQKKQKNKAKKKGLDMKSYIYRIVVENTKSLQRESVLLDNKYCPKAKYALIEKRVNKDSSENITRILYSSDMQELHNTAKDSISWYNYPLGLRKNIQGYIGEI